MTEQDRREFLKRSAAAAAALGFPATGALPSSADPRAAAGSVSTAAGASQAMAPGSASLRAIGTAVLPTGELGPEGVERTVADFEEWIEGFEAAAEMPHGYLSRGLAEIRYGPEHPGPRWAAQVAALESEAVQLHGSAFTDLSVDQRRELIAAQLQPEELERVPTPARASHVAVGLMAHFYGSSEATDLCYRARIGRYRCRGLGSLDQAPQPLSEVEPAAPVAPDASSGENT